MDSNYSWTKWAFLEAGGKISSKILQKLVGVTSSHMGHILYATGIIGFVQVLGGIVACRTRKISVVTNAFSVFIYCLMGAVTFITAVLGFATFLYGGEVSTNTFIITLSIVPGALIDRWFFNQKLNIQEWAGIVLAILAGYVILDTPSLSELSSLPTWVWLSFGTMLAVAVNQGITRAVEKSDPFVMNFWGGLTTIILCIVGLMFLGFQLIGNLLNSGNIQLAGLSALTGLIVLSMWVFSLMGYKRGATIALKRLVTDAVYLTGVMIIGVLFFQESFTIGKILGLIIYLFAFLLFYRASFVFKIKG